MYAVKLYRRDRAVTYARRWALSRNPLFQDFSEFGGNCTSFVSQCILAGSCTMNFTPTFGWYYRSISDRAPAWSGVGALYDFLTGDPIFEQENGGIGPYAVEATDAEAEPGDVIQLADESDRFYHSLIISEIVDGDFLVCAHTKDSLDRPLSTYSYARKRILHLIGVRIALPDASCYEDLLEGISIFHGDIEDY